MLVVTSRGRNRLGVCRNGNLFLSFPPGEQIRSRTFLGEAGLGKLSVELLFGNSG